MRQKMSHAMRTLSCLPIPSSRMSELQAKEFIEGILEVVHKIKQKRNLEMQFDSLKPTPKEVEFTILSCFASRPSFNSRSSGHQFDVQQTGPPVMTKILQYPTDPFFIDFFRVLLPMLTDFTCEEYMSEFLQYIYEVVYTMRVAVHSRN